ncbi:MAG: hypothetical protein VKK80_00655 [Prochlorothrix sp.]|nr:hypothetical protein [Prochlorothrix sp.]
MAVKQSSRSVTHTPQQPRSSGLPDRSPVFVPFSAQFRLKPNKKPEIYPR